MLKIKDNVDLKELEKFGFGQGLYGSEANKAVTICINENRKITITSPNHCWWDWDYYYNWNSDTDVIYDLIQAGLVEKVEDK